MLAELFNLVHLRICLFQAKVEEFLSTSKQTKALVLLRQLKFVETMLFRGSNPYCDQPLYSSSEPIVADAEIILIDML